MPVVSFDYIEQHEKMAEEITRLRAENAALATWQCEFTDGKTGLVYAEGGGTYCAMAKEVERLRAALREDARDFANRIERLEAALRYYACKCKNPHTGCAVEFERSGNARCGWEARAALEERT